MEMKKKYSMPELIKIHLDNEISLALESDPSAGPEEQLVFNQMNALNSNPFSKEQKS